MSHSSDSSRGAAPSFDRRLVEGPLPAAVWSIAWPTMLQNAFAGLQGIVDHAMVGHWVGHTGNAAIGVSWQIFLVVVVFVSSLFTGVGVLVARFAGAGDSEKAGRAFWQATLLSLVLGVAVFPPVGWIAAPWLLDAVNAAPEVQAEALSYLRILFVGGLGMLGFHLLGGALRAAGDARTPMRLGVTMTLLNLGFSVVLISGLGPIPAFGTAGAAWGTVLSGAIVAAIGFRRIALDRLVLRIPRPVPWRLDRPIVAAILRFGLPTGIQAVAMNLGGVLLIRYVGQLEHSAAAQAVYAVGYTQLFSLVSWTSVALMAAAATISGQSLGAGDPDRAARVPVSAAQLGLVLGATAALAFLAMPERLLGLFGMEEEIVLEIGSQLLHHLAVSAFFLPVALAYTGALQGTGDTKSPLGITLISQLAIPLGICAALDVGPGLTPGGIWSAIVAGHVTRCVLSVARHRQGRWRTIAVDVAALW